MAAHPFSFLPISYFLGAGNVANHQMPFQIKIAFEGELAKRAALPDCPPYGELCLRGNSQEVRHARRGRTAPASGARAFLTDLSRFLTRVRTHKIRR